MVSSMGVARIFFGGGNTFWGRPCGGSRGKATGVQRIFENFKKLS